MLTKQTASRDLKSIYILYIYIEVFHVDELD